jgi:hypothetical protein
MMQELARYWATNYDWRTCERRLNALPHFMTEIDGLDIHFIHVRSRHQDALPLIVTHGWPGSIIEQLKIIEPLTNPTAHGASAADAFHLVIPSLPGHGFSAKPATTGWDPTHHRLGSHPHRTCLGRADEAPRVHPVRRTGRRLGAAVTQARRVERVQPGYLRAAEDHGGARSGLGPGVRAGCPTGRLGR